MLPPPTKVFPPNGDWLAAVDVVPKTLVVVLGAEAAKPKVDVGAAENGVMVAPNGPVAAVDVGADDANTEFPRKEQKFELHKFTSSVSNSSKRLIYLQCSSHRRD